MKWRCEHAQSSGFPANMINFAKRYVIIGEHDHFNIQHSISQLGDFTRSSHSEVMPKYPHIVTYQPDFTKKSDWHIET